MTDLETAIATVEAAGLHLTTQPRVVFADNQVDGHRTVPLVLSTPLPEAVTDPAGADGEVPDDVRHLIDAACDEIWRYVTRLRGGDPWVIIDTIPGVDGDTEWNGIILNDFRSAKRTPIAAFVIQHGAGRSELDAWRQHALADHAILQRVAELAVELNTLADQLCERIDGGQDRDDAGDAFRVAARRIGEALTGVRATRAQSTTTDTTEETTTS